MERTSLLKLGGPVLKAPSNSVRRESSSHQGRRKSMAPGKDKTEKESTDEKSENKTRRWVPDTDKHLPGKPFGWKIYQDSVRFSQFLIGRPQKAFQMVKVSRVSKKKFQTGNFISF